MSKKISLTGDRPTGPLHIGHLFGSLLSRKELESEYQSYVMVADIQALTDNWENPEKVRENVYEITADNLAIGLDPDKTTFFIQSQVPQIAELTVLYSNLVTINTLRRNPTVKGEIAQKKALFGENEESLTFGFLGYPISQAADITVLRANIVPVGEDQLPMIEQTREIIEKFHRIYKTEVFPLPEAKLSTATRIIGLDGNAKMGKSLNNAIFIKDTPKETIEKIKTAKTDSGSDITFDPENRPEISNLVLIYSIVNKIKPEEAIKDLKDINYSSFKLKLAEDLNKYLAPIREKRIELISDKNMLGDVLNNGLKKVLTKAQETINLVKQAVKIDY
jgi:tryptophanyl-tRNA synthetase